MLSRREVLALGTAPFLLGRTPLLQAGRHVVDMRYRNPLFAIGGAISLLTLAGLLWRMR